MDYILFNTVTKQTSLHNNYDVPRKIVKQSPNPLDWVIYPVNEDLYDGDHLFILDNNIRFEIGDDIVGYANSGWGVVGTVELATNIGFFISNPEWIDDEEIERMERRDYKGLDIYDDSEDDYEDEQQYFLTDIER